MLPGVVDTRDAEFWNEAVAEKAPQQAATGFRKAQSQTRVAHGVGQGDPTGRFTLVSTGLLRRLRSQDGIARREEDSHRKAADHSGEGLGVHGVSSTAAPGVHAEWRPRPNSPRRAERRVRF